MEYELYHYGVKGQKWGVRRYQRNDGSLTPEGKMRYNNSDTSVTKKVKRDFNELSNQDFVRKYQTTKSAYAKRVEKYGDPYANSPVVKKAQRRNERQINKLGKRNDAKIRSLNKDINSFKGHENGIFTKNGKMVLSAKDVQQSVKSLTAQRDKYSKQVTDMVRKMSKEYQVSYDVTAGEYKLRLKT